MQSVKSTQPLSEDHIAMHPHEELVIIELLLQHPENTLSEILQEIYQETGSIYACSTTALLLGSEQYYAEEGHVVYCVNVYMHDIVAVNCGIKVC